MIAFFGGGGWFFTETDQVLAQERTTAVGMELRMAHRAVLDQYCVTCHNERIVNGAGAAPSPLVNQLRAVGLALDTMNLTEVEEQAEAWERVIVKLRAQTMPPAGSPRPDPSVR